MIDVKKAIEIAKGYVQGMYTDEQIEDLSLEETRVNDDEEEWIITVGFSIQEQETRVINPIFGLEQRTTTAPLVRKFKAIYIDRKTGAVNAMLIRDPFAAAQ